MHCYCAELCINLCIKEFFGLKVLRVRAIQGIVAVKAEGGSAVEGAYGTWKEKATVKMGQVSMRGTRVVAVVRRRWGGGREKHDGDRLPYFSAKVPDFLTKLHEFYGPTVKRYL